MEVGGGRDIHTCSDTIPLYIGGVEEVGEIGLVVV